MYVLARRLVFYAVTAYVAITVNFFLPHMMPGDPVETMIASAGGQLDSRSVEALKAQFGIGTGQSLWDQYLHYWGQLFQGNLGISISKYPSTVSQTIGSALWWTVILVGTSRERIVGEANRLLNDDAHYGQMAQAMNPYGDGLAAKRIRAVIEEQA